MDENIKDKSTACKDQKITCRADDDNAREFFKAIRDTLTHFNVPESAYSFNTPRENTVFVSYDGTYHVSYFEHNHEQERKSFDTALDAGAAVFGMLAGKLKAFRMKRYYRSL